MTNEELINAGYTRYDPTPYHECETDLFQKCIRDEKGKKYYINVNRWDYSKYNVYYIRYDASVQFCHKNNETVNVDCLDGWSIPDMEKFYEDLWNTGWFKYYESYMDEEDELYDEEGAQT